LVYIIIKEYKVNITSTTLELTLIYTVTPAAGTVLEDTPFHMSYWTNEWFCKHYKYYIGTNLIYTVTPAAGTVLEDTPFHMSYWTNEWFWRQDRTGDHFESFLFVTLPCDKQYE